MKLGIQLFDAGRKMFVILWLLLYVPNYEILH